MANHHLPPDHEQRAQILALLDATLLVEAAAGTGKTTSLVGRMVGLIREGRCRIENMAAVTFTRKAAAELRARFQGALLQAAHEGQGESRDRLLAAAQHFEWAFIGTIHSFCARLLRERPIEAGVDLAFRDLDEVEDRQVRELAWSEFVAGLFAEESNVLHELRELGLEIVQLRKSFLEFATYPDVDHWPAPVITTEDLQKWLVEHKLREQLRDYINHMEGLVPTFPIERGNDELMDKYEQFVRLGRHRDLERLADLADVLENMDRNSGVILKQWPCGSDQGRNERDRWDHFREQAAIPFLELWRAHRYATIIRLLQEAMTYYDRRRAANGQLNFQDLLLRAAGLLRDKPAIRRYFRERFTHLLVDEFQDTDPIQAQVMMYLTASDPGEEHWRNCRPVPGSLFVVGDPKQSIYRFRRADVVTYNAVKRIIEECGQVVSLTANFRSRSDLVRWGNELFEEHFPHAATPEAPAFVAMQVGRQGDQGGDLQGLGKFFVPEERGRKDDAVAYDAAFIARAIRHALDQQLTVPRSPEELQRGVPFHATPGDFLIITWGKKQLAQYARQLQELGIPHQVTGGSAWSQIEELALLRDCLRALTQPENPVALVAVLRGALFGVSDAQLYSFKKAGGRFSFRTHVPSTLEATDGDTIRGAFVRLARYEKWLRSGPPVAAIERLAADLGLLPRALAGPGGDVQAGTFGKAIELLRSAQVECPSAADLVDYLDELITNGAEFDGLPARADNRSVVRLMNLHKAKGLEAPVVFLANPTGMSHHPIRLHVDRTTDVTRGHLAVYEDRQKGQAKLLACPADWNDIEEIERKFLDAERARLQYVAATRAGSQLLIAQKATKNSANPWSFFADSLQRDDVRTLADPGPQRPPQSVPLAVTTPDIEAAAAQIESRRTAAATPTYATVTAKQVSAAPRPIVSLAGAGEHGPEWGTVIHLLLETALRSPDRDLKSVALAALAEQGLSSAAVEEALHTVRAVIDSKFWNRVRASAKFVVEVPFAFCCPDRQAGNDLPTVVRGVVDLAFREADGWVIVDYKTDVVSPDTLPAAAERYRGQLTTYREAWREISGEAVKEAGLFFTRLGQFQPVAEAAVS